MMSSGKLLLAGVLVVGVAALALSKNSHAASGSVPPPAPGPGATSHTVPANAGLGLPALSSTQWHVNADTSGQQAGTMILIKSTQNPNDWVLAFQGTNGGIGILTYSQTPVAGQIAQALAAGLIG